ncbi:hypothetical protein LMG27174_06135 [Paraburkholderia rhynchosiae]|uniref:Uncharacterized protein n=1 Tax=Paraburkholderia rhynchosiae TaxID=487049 RepID=A0A6J5CEE6_9BURK|nr:hypothetical protein LMG27174_06135 [Paraburkholderia rhynchosiae]
MLQDAGDVDNLLKTHPETLIMTFVTDLEFKRLNACCTRAGRLFFCAI